MQKIEHRGTISLKFVGTIAGAALLGLIALIAFLAYRISVDQQETILKTQQSVYTLSRFVAQLEKELTVYTASTTANEKNGDEQLNDLRKVIEERGETGTEKLSTGLIQDIMKRIVFVYCKGSKGEWRGSGSTQLMWNEDPIVLTNYHIADVGKPEDVRCEIHLPLPPEYSTYGKAFLGRIMRFDGHYPIVDVAILQIQDVSSEEREEYFSSFPVEFCRSEDIKAGNDVTLFGYPKFGGNTLTLTTGVISGFLKTEWGNKYKTSAKMDLGNSGGLAVDNGFRCIIGIPTWTQYGGRIGDLLETGESLGQIQSWEMIVTSGGLFK